MSVAKFAAIEAACGDMSRSAWVEAAIDAYLSSPAVSVPGELAASPVPVYGYPADMGGGVADAVSVYGTEEPERPPCKHPADRIDDTNVCHECGADVW